MERLLACPEFADRYECRLFTNYVKEPVPDDLLARCDLFLYQYLGPGWGDLASEKLLGKLPQGARSLCVPNMFFKGYWPMWSGEKGFDYRCSHLDEIIDMGLPPEETVLLFLRLDVTKQFDLLDVVNRTLQQEREREAHTPVKYLHVIVDNYREQRLFNTVNHPGGLLVNHAAKGVLEHLGFTPPEVSRWEALGEPFPEFEQPVNPAIGAFFGWDFAKQDTQYEIYGRKMTFTRYVANYVTARKAGITDFIGYLQGDYVEI